MFSKLNGWISAALCSVFFSVPALAQITTSQATSLTGAATFTKAQGAIVTVAAAVLAVVAVIVGIRFIRRAFMG